MLHSFIRSGLIRAHSSKITFAADSYMFPLCRTSISNCLLGISSCTFRQSMLYQFNVTKNIFFPAKYILPPVYLIEQPCHLATWARCWGAPLHSSLSGACSTVGPEASGPGLCSRYFHAGHWWGLPPLWVFPVHFWHRSFMHTSFCRKPLACIGCP